MDGLILNKQDQRILEKILKRKSFYEKKYNIILTDDIIKKSFLLEKQMLVELYK
jgi:hypothetical protein